MFSSARARLPTLSTRSSRLITRPFSSSSCLHTENRMPVNDPRPKDPPPNISASNALPIDAAGARDAPLQEMPEDGERQRQLQSPNRAERWSRSQSPRHKAMTGPRFEQTIMDFQVSPAHPTSPTSSAIVIANIPCCAISHNRMLQLS